MERCMDCSRDFKNKHSLRTHSRNFHRTAPPKTESTIAVVNRNYKHNDKELMSLGSTSGESSDSDETIHPEFDSELDEGLEVADEYNADNEVDRHKRRHVSDSSDEELEPKGPRKDHFNSTSDELDAELEIVDEYNDSDEVGKYIKHLRHKRKHVSDSSGEEPEAKIPRPDDADSTDADVDSDIKEPERPRKKRFVKTRKRKHLSDSSDEEQTRKTAKFNRSPKRRHYSKSSDEEPKKKARRLPKKRSKTHDEATMNAEIEMKDKKIEKQKDKIADLQHLLKMEKDRMKLYAKQLDSIKGTSNKMTPIEKILTNNVTLEQINQIRYLIKSGHLQPILDNDNLVTAIQNVCMGMLEGVIPIANPQTLAFTDDHYDYMRALEKMDVSEAGDFLVENPKPLAEIFFVLDKSLKLMTKTYLKFVEPTSDDEL